MSDSPLALSVSMSLSFLKLKFLIMAFSQDGLRHAVDGVTPACSLRNCEDSFQYLRFLFMSVMHMASGLYSLLRNGLWNGFASVNVHTLFGALGLGSESCFRVREQSVPAAVSSVEVIRKTATAMGWDSVPNHLNEHIVGLLDVRCFWKRQPSVPSSGTIAVGVISKKPTPTTWDSLPNDLQANAFQRVAFRDLSRFKIVSKSWKKFVEEGEAFRESLGGTSQDEFTAINYYIKNKSWRCSGYDLHSKSWRTRPQLSYLPPPNEELFKEYSVSGHGGLMCAKVSKLPKTRELVVFNPLTGESRALPLLLHLRNPVLVHISIDSDKKFYKVIVPGSSAASDEHLSRKMEVFDSSTAKWKEVSDRRGPAFDLNEHQAGVGLNGKLFVISFLGGSGRGVVAFDLQEEKWLPDPTAPIPWSSSSNTLQLFVSDGKLFLISEQQRDQCLDHCIDELEFQNPKAGTLTCRWRSFVKVKISGGRGLQVYPEHTCVNFILEKLSMFNPLSKKLLNYLLPLCLATMPSGACAGQKSLMESLSSMWNLSNAWESPEFAKNAAVTLLVGITMIGGRVAWKIFRRRQARGNRFNIDGGLKKETPDPRSREAERAISPAIPV